MKRGIILSASVGVLLLLGLGLYRSGWLFGSNAETTPAHVTNADPMDTPSGWRYRQNLPSHWRYIMLQK
jgi:hypothetical protein